VFAVSGQRWLPKQLLKCNDCGWNLDVRWLRKAEAAVHFVCAVLCR